MSYAIGVLERLCFVEPWGEATLSFRDGLVGGPDSLGWVGYVAVSV
jgi:hypothetical protein